jgi:hypothetical protein
MAHSKVGAAANRALGLSGDWEISSGYSTYFHDAKSMKGENRALSAVKKRFGTL